MSIGCGHILFDGHGNPARWLTFWPGGTPRDYMFGGGIRIWDFPRLLNGIKVPICVIGGCHSSLFNVTLLSTVSDRDNSQATWSHGRPVPECWSWSLTRKAHGGAIATLGNTGLGYEAEGDIGDLDGDGIDDPDCVEKLGGYQETQFYKLIAEGEDILGDAWAGATNAYLQAHPD